MVAFVQESMNEVVDSGDAVVSFTWAESPSAATALVEAICDATDASPIDLPPLYETIDPDALETTLGDPADDSAGGRIEFAYHDYRVTMQADGEGSIYERDAAASA